MGVAQCPTSFQLVEASGCGRLRKPTTSWKLVGYFRRSRSCRNERRPERMKARREGRANWQFALIPSMRSFGKLGQTASLPYLYRRRKYADHQGQRQISSGERLVVGVLA